MSRLIQLDAVSRTYRRGSSNELVALHDVTLAIDESEFVAVVGPSGSGKSTLMHLLGLLDMPTGGTYRLEGSDVRTWSADRRARVRGSRIGFVFQSFGLLARSTAVENVELPLLYAGVRADERRRRAIAALELVGLGRRLAHWPGQLSGGEQQRVAIARAVVTEPALILADEPTGAIDTRTGLSVLALFQKLNRTMGRTIVLVTHDPNVALHAQRVVSLRDGAVIADRPVTAPRNAEAEQQRSAADGASPLDLGCGETVSDDAA